MLIVVAPVVDWNVFTKNVIELSDTTAEDGLVTVTRIFWLARVPSMTFGGRVEETERTSVPCKSGVATTRVRTVLRPAVLPALLPATRTPPVERLAKPKYRPPSPSA